MKRNKSKIANSKQGTNQRKAPLLQEKKKVTLHNYKEFVEPLVLSPRPRCRIRLHWNTPHTSRPTRPASPSPLPTPINHFVSLSFSYISNSFFTVKKRFYKIKFLKGIIFMDGCFILSSPRQKKGEGGGEETNYFTLIFLWNYLMSC